MRKKVLLIEDNYDLRELIAELLELNGYSVLSARDGGEGLAMAVTELPALIVSDLRMPVLSGYELISCLQRDVRTHQIPVVLTSAKFGHNSDVVAQHKNVAAYLEKPFNEEKLLKCISNALRT